MKKIILLFCTSLFFITIYAQEIKTDTRYKSAVRQLDPNKVLQTIAFGSCNNQSKSQEMWKHIVKNRPELWIWLGDIIYADTKNMNVMAEKYSLVKNNMNYRRLLACAPVIGIWDDHDFGWNDAGKEYSMKKESKRLMLDFLDVSKQAKVRKREGAYQTFTFGKDDKKVKIFLLDTRYFRDGLEKSSDPKSRYKPNEQGDILGEQQWQWLEKELKNSEAKINIIASGVQMIPTEHGFEKWANFPKARKRLFHLLQKTKPQMPILISGDRHIAEVSKLKIPTLEQPVYEVTSSGLTHSWSQKRAEPNQYRVGKLVIEKNFAVLKIDWSGEQPKVKVEVRGLENELFLEQRLGE